MESASITWFKISLFFLFISVLLYIGFRFPHFSMHCQGGGFVADDPSLEDFKNCGHTKEDITRYRDGKKIGLAYSMVAFSISILFAIVYYLRGL